MNRLKEKILDSTGGIRGLIFLCITVSSMVIVIVLFSSYTLYPSPPAAITTSPRSSRVIQRPSEASYAEVANIIRLEKLTRLEELIGLKDFIKLEELSERLDAILEGRH